MTTNTTLISAYRGQGVRMSFALLDAAGDRIDLTGKSFVCVIYRRRNGSVAWPAEPQIVTADSDTVSFDILGVETEFLYLDGYVLRWEFTQVVAGGLQPWAVGDFELLERSGFLAAGVSPAPTVAIEVPMAQKIVSVTSVGVPGITEWEALNFAGPEEYDAHVAARAVHDGFASEPMVSGDMDATELILIWKDGTPRTITFDQLALAIAQYRTLNLATPTGAAIADAIGILG